MATKIANALEVSLDYLVGKTDLELDDSMLNRIQAVTKMSAENRSHLFSLLDDSIIKTKKQVLV